MVKLLSPAVRDRKVLELQMLGLSLFHSVMTYGKKVFEVLSSPRKYIKSVRISVRISHS